MDAAQVPEVPGYDVGRLLGRGGSADVWLATEQASGRACALKCFRRSDGDGPEPAMPEEEVRREIRIISALDHPHLIRAYRAVRVAGPEPGTALAMDYAAGGSLATLVASRGRLSVGESITVLTPMAQVLGYLHAQGFTHSDVAPGNILFTGQGKPMLSDLGVARMLADPGVAAAAGTGGFVDPAPVDAVRAGLQPGRDVYSLAAVGWFCLTGEAPGATADRLPLPLLVPGVPKELAAALEQGLSEDRRLRPTATALGLAIYRSAAPAPLDLSGAVHPTVLPELLTRRSMPAAPKRRVLGETRRRLQRRAATLQRRVTSLRWPGPPQGTRSRPETLIPAPAAPQGKHAAVPGGPGVLRRTRPRARLVLAAVGAAAAGTWWLSAAAGAWPGAGFAAPGATVDPGVAISSGPAAPGQDGGRGAAGVPADAAEQAAAADPAVAVRGLSTLRDHALTSGKLELLAAVTAPGSAAAAADQEVAGHLGPAGLRLDGFSTTVSDIAIESGPAQDRCVVALTSAASGYRTVGPGGEVQSEGAASPDRRLRLVLVLAAGRWRISDILPGS